MNFTKTVLAAIRRWRYWLLAGPVSVVGVALLLSWVSSAWKDANNWPAFSFVLVLGAIFLIFGWWLIKGAHPPGWLDYLMLGAVFLRLFLGVVWFVVIPSGGYDSPAEKEGYVLADAYNRDRAAWKIADRHYPVWRIPRAVRSLRKFDQYGGMLLISSLIYQASGTQRHQPLMMVVVTASFSALAVLFGWAFARRAWGDRAANITAWGLALYPEAVLLGSSQMREAFLIPLITASFYYALAYIQDHHWKYLVGVMVVLLFCLPFSPPVTTFVLAILVIFGLMVGNRSIFKQRGVWLALIVFGSVLLLGIWFAWGSYAPNKISDPLSLIAWWVKSTVGLQARFSRLDSGWIQKIFKDLPEWLRSPLLVSYGMARPLLPAALIDVTSKPIWRWISIWRAFGWTILLPFLVYAPILSLRSVPEAQKQWRSIGRSLSVIVWLGVLAASLRAGGDLWDNPRYRAMFAGLQLALAAWVWVSYRQRHDVWLRRVLVGTALVLLWFIPWYLGRYTLIDWPVVDFFKTLGLGLASLVLYFVWDLVGKRI